MMIWIPAFAGMTAALARLLWHIDEEGVGG
jgi:hypothetical protein